MPNHGTQLLALAGRRGMSKLRVKIKQLRPQRMAEVEDFVDFLRAREDENRLTHAAAKEIGRASCRERVYSSV